jgi:hypothetical protein
MRKAWPAIEPSPKNSPSPNMPMVASWPVFETTVSLTRTLLRCVSPSSASIVVKTRRVILGLASILEIKYRDMVLARQGPRTKRQTCFANVTGEFSAAENMEGRFALYGDTKPFDLATHHDEDAVMQIATFENNFVWLRIPLLAKCC